MRAYVPLNFYSTHQFSPETIDQNILISPLFHTKFLTRGVIRHDVINAVITARGSNEASSRMHDTSPSSR